MHRRVQYRGILIAGVCAAMACATESTSTTPQLQPPVVYPAPAGPSYIISGVVYDNTPDGRHPAPGLPLEVLSASAWATPVQVSRDTIVTADSAGRYSAPVWGDMVIIKPAAGSTFLSPCPAGTHWVGQNPNKSFDVDVVSKAVLSTSGLPDSYQGKWLFVAGTVTEATAQGPRPVSGATVVLGSETWAFDYSTTLTDAGGRYLVCTETPGAGTDQMDSLTVIKNGYASSRGLVFLGYNPTVNVELARAP